MYVEKRREWRETRVDAGGLISFDRRERYSSWFERVMKGGVVVDDDKGRVEEEENRTYSGGGGRIVLYSDSSTYLVPERRTKRGTSVA